MDQEKKKIIYALIYPLLFLLLIWAIKILETVFDYSLSFLGVLPLEASGLAGIVLSPFLHGSYSHLLANSLPIVVLGFSLFFFYRDIAVKTTFLVWLMSGLWLWAFARGDAYHIGSSTLIYGLAAFLFFSGLIRRQTQLMAISLMVIFLYGSMIWGVFPDFFPDRNISWEGHLTGMVSGIILSIYFRKQGPQRKKYQWEIEEEEERALSPTADIAEGQGEEKKEDMEDKISNTEVPPEMLKYIYKKKDNK